MKEYYLVHQGDGSCWENIPAVELHHTGWLEAAPVRAWARMCHDGENLYVAMEAEESPVRATLSGLLDQVCDDSCLEFFFAPDAEDERYFNFEWNPLGALNLGFGGARATRVRQIVKKPQELFQPKVWQAGDRWGIQFRVPVEFVQRYFPRFCLKEAGAANFYKCGDQTVRPHYLAWSPLTTDTPDYHRRGDFGCLSYEQA